MSVRHFLSLMDLTPAELSGIINRAQQLKTMQHQHQVHAPFSGYSMGMIFEKASTRTRLSFEIGMSQLGGHALFLSPDNTQLGRGEPIEDSSRVMSSMVDIMMIRTFAHNIIERFAAVSTVPVINALTDDYHPCQLLADMQTYAEHRGSINGKRVCWIGDGNNMCNSYINAARQFDFELIIACPEGFEPLPTLLDANKSRVSIVRNPIEAARDTDLLVTDVWASMGQEQEQKQREQAFSGYQLNHDSLAAANSDALYMHCLPAHRDEEISSELMDASDTVIWDEAENRLHAQKALIEFLLSEQ